MIELLTNEIALIFYVVIFTLIYSEYHIKKTENKGSK